MKTTNVKIKFETFNDYNFLIDVAGNDLGALSGLSLLQDELPAELSFHVPETYHKRIIGVGGKNIQRIMKEFSSYVKFNSADELVVLGGYAENEDNVIARTPMKNFANLEFLKSSILEQIPFKDKDFVRETVEVPRRYHRILLGEKGIFLHDIESKTNSVFRFPTKESASDLVEIFAPESQISVATSMLLDHVPYEAFVVFFSAHESEPLMLSMSNSEYRIPHSERFADLTQLQDFANLTERIKRDFNITILSFVDRSGQQEESLVRFCLIRSNVEFLASARDVVEQFLSSRGVRRSFQRLWHAH